MSEEPQTTNKAPSQELDLATMEINKELHESILKQCEKLSRDIIEMFRASAQLTGPALHNATTKVKEAYMWVQDGVGMLHVTKQQADQAHAQAEAGNLEVVK